MASFGASTEVLAAQLSVPLELKEAVCTICWAAPFLDNSAELMKIRSLMFDKYRNDDHLRQNTFVHRKVLLGLSHDMPADSLIDYYLSTILNEHETPETVPTAKSASSSSSHASPTGPSMPAAPAPSLSQPSESTLIVGQLRIDSLGHHWVIPDDQSSAIFIAPRHTLGAFDMDSVQASLDQRPDGKRSGRVTRLLKQSILQPPHLAGSSPSAPESSKAADSLTFKGSDSGTFRIDTANHAWVTGTRFGDVFIPPVAARSLTASATIHVQVFELHHRLIAVPLPSAVITPLDNASQSPESNQYLSLLEENPILKMVSWSSVPEVELIGVFKSEGDEFGLVLPAELGASPVVVLGDFHRSGAKTGDKVTVKTFGEAVNPSTLTTYPLGKIVRVTSPITSPASQRSKDSRNSEQDRRRVQLVSPGAGDFSAPLEIDEDGNGTLLHPTLPWTYVIIPRSELGSAVPGDVIAVELIDAKPSHGKMTGRFVGVVSALESYSIEHELELIGSSNSERSQNRVDSVDRLEEDLQPLDDFEAGPTQQFPLPTDLHITPKDVVVIDFGSGRIKIGRANQPVPILSIPNLAGRLQDSLLPQSSTLSARDSPDLVVGESALERRALLSLTRPFERGAGKDWSAIKALLFKALGSTGAEPGRTIAVLLESEAGPWSENRKMFADLFFEFGLPYVRFARSGPCALLSERRQGGIVIDIGHTSSTISVIENGVLLPGLRTHFPLAGLDVTNQLASLLAEDGYRLWRTESQKASLEAMKLSVAFVKSVSLRGSTPKSVRSEQGLESSKSSDDCTYKLENGMEVIVGERAWQCMEIFFNPSVIGLDSPSLPDVVMETLQKVRAATSLVHSKQDVSETIMLVGGTSLVPGLRQRLQAELHLREQRSGSEERPYIEQPLKAQLSNWIGGAQLVTSSPFKTGLISAQNYRNFGLEALKD